MSSYDLNAAFKKALGPKYNTIYSKPATITTAGKSYEMKPFEESGFIGFTGVGTDQAKQFSFGDFGTKFLTEKEAKEIGAIDKTGKSVISGKGVFTTFSDTFRNVTSQNLENLGQASIDASAALEEQAAATAGAFAGLQGFITQVQEQLGQVDKRLSEQVTQIGQDTTELGQRQNGDGSEPFWNNIAAGLGVSVPILAIGGIAALLLLRR